MNKYKLDTNDFRIYLDKSIYRVISDKVCGFIEDTSCLSQEGSCEIDERSSVLKGCSILQDAKIHNSNISGAYTIEDSASIVNSTVCGVGEIGGNSKLCNCSIFGDLVVEQSAILNNVSIVNKVVLVGEMRIDNVLFCSRNELIITARGDYDKYWSYEPVVYGWELRSESPYSVNAIKQSEHLFCSYTYYNKPSKKESRTPYIKELLEVTPDVIFVEGIYVRPEYRRQGYGTAILRELYDHCPRGTVLALEVSEFSDAEKMGMDSLRAFYTKNGFEVVKDNLMIKTKE